MQAPDQAGKPSNLSRDLDYQVFGASVYLEPGSPLYEGMEDLLRRKQEGRIKLHTHAEVWRCASSAFVGVWSIKQWSSFLSARTKRPI